MKILVSAASKHGATRDIGQEIGSALREEGFTVSVLPPEQVDSIAGYDAMVLGSAVYVGHWLPVAKNLIHRWVCEFDDRPVWLFSSGPIGDPPRPMEDPVDIAELTLLTSARGHHLFTGSILKRKLSFPERAVVRALRVPEGDFRDWSDVQSWAREIANALRGGTPGDQFTRTERSEQRDG